MNKRIHKNIQTRNEKGTDTLTGVHVNLINQILDKMQRDNKMRSFFIDAIVVILILRALNYV